MVEFALVGPTFLFLLFMVFEGSLFINAQATIDNATREGARVAALCGDSHIYSYLGVTSAVNCYAPVEEAVDTHLGILPVAAVNGVANPNISPSCNICPTGTTITLTVTYQYNYYVPSLLGLYAGTQINSVASVVSQQ
jgi:Flp pilus assembly protein TadG